MTATFLVEVEIDSPTDVLTLIDEIHDAVEQGGISVQFVKFWARGGVSSFLPNPNPPV